MYIYISILNTIIATINQNINKNILFSINFCKLSLIN